MHMFAVAGGAILLTTHSMEEADVLGDSIAIWVASFQLQHQEMLFLQNGRYS